MGLLSAPFYSCFSIRFYRQVIRSSVGQGFLYLFLLSFLATAAIFHVLTNRIVPQVNQFVEWAKAEMPPMTLGPEGVLVYLEMPYTMTHPQFGPLVTFDTTQTEVTAQTMGNTPVFVTTQRLYIQQANGELRIYDLAEMMRNAQAEQGAVKVDSQSIQAFYDAMRPWMIAVFLFLFFLFTYSWKLLAAVFYSWFGLLINFSRKPKLNYGAIFNVSIFAQTPWFLIQLLGLLISPSGQVPFSFFLGLPITGLFLYLGIKLTEDRPAAQTTPA